MTQFYIERILRNLLSHIQKIELISDFSKAVGYKVNAQKLITFLYTSNEQAATGIKKDITIYIGTQKILNRYKSNKIYTIPI